MSSTRPRGCANRMLMDFMEKASLLLPTACLRAGFGHCHKYARVRYRLTNTLPFAAQWRTWVDSVNYRLDNRVLQGGMKINVSL